MSSHAPAAVQTLKDAMRRARADDAERSSALADLRVSRIARLEILQDALTPLLAQIPKECDLFDVALMPGAAPRLFIDMIGFVEMGRDARVYHFLQDTRHGRVKLAESAVVETMVAAITDYVARRLLERDKALAADHVASVSDTAPVATREPAKITKTAVETAPQLPEDASPASGRSKALRWIGIGFAFLIDLLGSIAFFTILAGLAWVLYNRLHGHVS